MAKKRVEVSLKKYIEALRGKNIRVNKAILYGSLAAGTGGDDSDIDLAIISPDLGRDRFNEAVELKKLTFGIDLDISPRPYSVEQYQKAKQAIFYMMKLYRRERPFTKSKPVNIGRDQQRERRNEGGQA